MGMFGYGVSKGARRVLVFTVLTVTTVIPVLLLLQYSRVVWRAPSLQ